MSSNVDILRNLTNPKFNTISPASFIQNLKKAVLNVEAFQHHPYNFKQSIIADYFARIGINGISNSLKTYGPLKTLLEQKYGNPAGIESGIIFKIIDDLAQRRNDVAHGVENVELLNVTIIKEYTEFILAYCKSLYKIFLNEINMYLFNETETNLTLLSVINHSIVCGSVKSISFSNSDKLITEKPEGNFPRCESLNIQDVQINNVSHQSLSISDRTDIRIKINGYVKDSYKFKIITEPNNG